MGGKVADPWAKSIYMTSSLIPFTYVVRLCGRETCYNLKKEDVINKQSQLISFPFRQLCVFKNERLTYTDILLRWNFYKTLLLQKTICQPIFKKMLDTKLSPWVPFPNDLNQKQFTASLFNVQLFKQNEISSVREAAACSGHSA